MLYDETLLQENQPPQTGMEMEGSPAEGGLRHVLEGPFPQTGSDLPEDGEEMGDSKAGSEAISQTSSESSDGSEFSSDPRAEETEEPPLPQTGSKMAENEGGVDLKAPGDAVSSQTGIKMEEEDHGSASPVRSQSQSGRTPPRRRRVIRRTPVLAIGDGPTVETEADKARSDLLDLVESQKMGRILTGTIQGVERPRPETSLAVLYHGSFKIIIPAEQAVTLPDDRRGRSVAELYNYMLTKRLGAEVDYIVKGVEPRTGLAAGSRLEAMSAKRREYYGADRAGNRQIHEGICAEARIVSVIRAGIFVELFGLETYIPLRELSYQRWMDAGLYFQAGQRVLVKVLEVEASDREHSRVVASVKQAGPNPYEKALWRYSVGSCYVGTVSMVDINGVFVALDEGVDCLCSYPKRGRPPRGARVTVRILGINKESNRIWGAITHIAAAR